MLGGTLAATAGTLAGTVVGLGPASPVIAAGPPAEKVKVLIADVVQARVADFASGVAQAVALERVAGQGRLRGASGGEFVSEPVKLPFGATHLGLHWWTTGDPYGVRVSVRSSGPGRGWSEWQSPEVDDVVDHGQSKEVFAALASSDRGELAQYRVQFLADGATVGQVTITAINSVDGPREVIANAAPTSVTVTTPDGKVLTIITREGWGCDESLRFSGGKEIWPEMYVPAKKIIIHHTATSNGYTDGAAQVRAIYAYQAGTRSWGDIGYHVLVDRYGRFFEGRHGRGEGAGREILSPDVVGAHVYYRNYGSVGVSCIGNFEVASPTSALLTGLDNIVTYECGIHYINPTGVSDFYLSTNQWQYQLKNISGHYESWQTACPGVYMISYLPTLRSHVSSRLGTTPAPALSVVGTPDLYTPGALSFSWPSGGTKYYCLEGWDFSDEEDITYLSGYTAAGFNDPGAMKMAWTATTGTAASFPNLRAGRYTMHLRNEGGRFESNRTFAVGAYLAQYFPNETLSGTPTISRAEQAPIDHDWGTGSPGAGIPDDGFSARWQGTFDFNGAAYTFVATADDGIRVYLDGNRIIDGWRIQAATTYEASVTVSAGQHSVKVEYFENTGLALARVYWYQKPPVGQYYAEYFNNRTLSGLPKASYVENAPINYDWGLGCPESVSVDNFSIRWTGDFNFDAAPYTFIARSDDGVRLWVDGVLLIDQWHDEAPTEYRATRAMSAGVHRVRVEYYEHTGGALIQVNWVMGSTTSPTRTTVIVDDTSSGFSKGGSYWRESTAGYGGHQWWTYVDGSAVDCWGNWQADLAGGSYEVYVWVPYWNATTRNAPYTVYHQDGQTVRSVNQDNYSNVWVSIGTYSFTAGTALRVRLTDATGEPINSRKIAFDAVMLVPR